MAVEREAGEAALKVLSQLPLGGQIDLYFDDEAGFSMQPVLPRVAGMRRANKDFPAAG